MSDEDDAAALEALVSESDLQINTLDDELAAVFDDETPETLPDARDIGAAPPTSLEAAPTEDGLIVDLPPEDSAEEGLDVELPPETDEDEALATDPPPVASMEDPLIVDLPKEQAPKTAAADAIEEDKKPAAEKPMPPPTESSAEALLDDRDEEDHVGVASSAEKKLANAERRLSVTLDRKSMLLIQAREARCEWIAQVPTPYRKSASSSSPWQTNQKLAQLSTMNAAREVPSALGILAALYGLDETRDGNVVAEHLQALLGPTSENDEAFPLASEILRQEQASNPSLASYHRFLSRLQDPSLSMTVQGMRNYCRRLNDVTAQDELVSSLQSYSASTVGSLQSNAVFKNEPSEDIRRALEAFLYGQTAAHLDRVLWTADARRADQDWMDRVSALQFVTPKHLEIACLGEDEVDELLVEPISALQSVDSYYSAFDKLQRILAVYHGVNHALRAALDRHHDGKLPSADDVLPTIILTVLRAKPERLLHNLDFVEHLSPADYLRGEAGYAFTNLYGAVQFLQDMNLDSPESLSINPEEFRTNLEACRAKSKDRLASLESKARPDAGKPPTVSLDELHIPPVEIRKARLRGEDIDLDWALRWQMGANTNNDCKERASESPVRKERANTDEIGIEGMPEGFTRTYSFLSSRPEDIRVTDLPKLLSEYRLLVHTTERLLGERAAQKSKDRKAKSLAVEKELFARVRAVDPALLLTVNGKNKSKTFD